MALQCKVHTFSAFDLNQQSTDQMAKEVTQCRARQFIRHVDLEALLYAVFLSHGWAIVYVL